MQEKKEKKAFDRSGSTMKHIRFEDDLLEQINTASADTSFSAWVKTACRNELERLGVKSKS
ncbi:YlcI/YnfO family protein [Providencia manganoxydans]